MGFEEHIDDPIPYKGPRIVVTGGRDYNDVTHVYEVLRVLDPSHVMVGDASGVDEYTRQWCEDRGVRYTVYAAEWDEFGKKAGPIRNQRMLKAADASFLVAFPGGRGTENCVSQAQKMGLPVVRAVPTPDEYKREEVC